MAGKRRFRSRGKFRRFGGRRRRNFRLKKFVKGVVGRMSEVKYGFVTAPINLDANLLYIQYINPGFNQGVDKYFRIGNKIKYRRLSLRLEFWLNNGIAPVNYFARGCRVIIFQTRLALSAPIVALDFLDTANWLSTTKGTAVRIMYDKFMVLTPQGAATTLATNTGHYLKSLHFKVNNNVNFRDVTVNVPTDYKDQYYLVILTDQFAQGANVFNVQGSWFTRLSFTDT